MGLVKTIGFVNVLIIIRAQAVRDHASVIFLDNMYKLYSQLAKINEAGRGNTSCLSSADAVIEKMIANLPHRAPKYSKYLASLMMLRMQLRWFDKLVNINLHVVSQIVLSALNDLIRLHNITVTQTRLGALIPTSEVVAPLLKPRTSAALYRSPSPTSVVAAPSVFNRSPKLFNKRAMDGLKVKIGLIEYLYNRRKQVI